MSHAVMKAFLNPFSSSGGDVAVLTAIAVEADQRNQVWLQSVLLGPMRQSPMSTIWLFWLIRNSTVDHLES